MSRQRQAIGVLVLAAAVSAASTSAGDEWDDFHITIDPLSPTSEDTFDLRAFRWFPDSGYLGIDQSVSVSGNQIDVRALVQDQHTRPGSVFLTVMTPVGAFFNDFGPLTAGTYHVSAEIWLTPWPSTSGGYLYDEGSLQFTVTGVGRMKRPPATSTATTSSTRATTLCGAGPMARRKATKPGGPTSAPRLAMATARRSARLLNRRCPNRQAQYCSYHGQPWEPGRAAKSPRAFQKLIIARHTPTTHRFRHRRRPASSMIRWS